MKRKLAACMLSLLIGTVVAANANALACKLFNQSIDQQCEAACNKIQNDILRGICL
ncbi:hypothetical protein [Xenorhabdus ishibashii]|uniref:Uncharacterized protein n=1 Tax=Xenorhabdus ishibashii TaxID=1034471 RepID=A0A2D0KA70_9GAMM|nr:hypothetical protein [Xenorhabdus ishibashii]PHM60097.1 hypothetical protein Xish_03240 [Xenorhabdus ishibashii]